MIKHLRELIGYSSNRFIREFPTKNWNRRGLDNLLAKTDCTGSIDHVEGSGHRACDTVTFLERETPDSVDYSIWIVLQEKVYHSRIITDLDELGGLIYKWAQLDQSIIDAAICQWHRRLCACVSARGAHFEHKF